MPQYVYDLRGSASDLQLGRDGGRLVWTGGHFLATTSDGVTPAQVRVPTTPTNPNDAASKAYVDANSGGSVASSAYDVILYVPLQADPNEVVLIHTFTRDVTFLDNFAGSTGYVQTTPTASYVLTVARDGTTIGTITISTGGVFTFATTAATDEVFLTGSRMTITAPATTDGTLNNMTFTLAGTK